MAREKTEEKRSGWKEQKGMEREQYMRSSLTVCIIILCKHVLLPLWYLIARLKNIIYYRRIYTWISHIIRMQIHTYVYFDMSSAHQKFIFNIINFKIMPACYILLHHRILEINSNIKYVRVRMLAYAVRFTHDFSVSFKFCLLHALLFDIYICMCVSINTFLWILAERLYSLFWIWDSYCFVVGWWFAFTWSNRMGIDDSRYNLTFYLK